MGSKLRETGWLSNAVLLIFSLVSLVQAESTLLNSVPTTFFKLQAELNQNVCHEATSLLSSNRNFAGNLTSQRLLYPKVETFVLERGICLTNKSQDILGDSRFEMTDVEIDFSNCIVSGFKWHSNRSSYSSCELVRVSSLSLAQRQRVLYALLDCTSAPQKNTHYCLVLVSSPSRKQPLEKKCSRRILLFSFPTISDGLLTSGVIFPTSYQTTASLFKAPSSMDKAIDFVKKNPFIFGSIVAGLLLLIIVIAVLAYRRRVKNKNMAPGFELEGPSSVPKACGQKGSGESVVYHEPNVHTTAQSRNASEESDGIGRYDYAYAHRFRRTKRGYQGKSRSYEDISEAGYIFQEEDRRLGAGDEEECNLFSRSQALDASAMPLHYVKVL